ncbi:ATP-grasp domain-containing protein [Xenorhabdus bovienii]|uniref:ATP-grasp domain-containing protein n=1 Tax=Xenorhabdus bovienii TaxID=40576 RepID=UPI0021577D85|nr:ATP-grasp domain-containing protein [Xenorhabdus bovienii]
MKIAIINPVSSGKCLVNAFEDFGVEIIQVFEPSLASEECSGFISEELGKTADFLMSQRITGIVSGSEFGISLTDELTHSLGLQGNDYELRKTRINKYEMMRILKANSIRTPHTEVITCEQELLTYLDSYPNYPVFIKPTASAGSDNCKKCNSRKDVISGFQNIFREKNILGKTNQSLVLQEYIQGDQYIINTVSSAGRHFITELYLVNLEKIDGMPIYRDISTLNYHDQGGLITELSNYVFECLDGIGIRNGAAHTEVRMTENGPLLIEVNSRIMGPILDINAFSHGIGYSQASILAESMAEPEIFNRRLSSPIQQPKRYFSMVFLRCPFEGRIVDRKGLSNVRKLPGFHSVVHLPHLGYISKNPLLTTGDFGIAYFAHEDKEVLDNSIAILHQIENDGLLYGVDCD